MKNVTPKKLMMYVVLLGAILLAGVYFLVYKSYTEKAETLKLSNVALSERVAELKEYYDNMENYNQEIAAMQDEIHNILGQFPADVMEEDMIVLALDTMKRAAVDYTNINIGEREAIRSIPAATVQAAGMEDLQLELAYVKRTGTYVNTTSYQNLKECVETINNSENRVAITNISYSRNETSGELAGTIEVSFYSVLGTGKPYEPQNLADYASGLAELFGVAQVEE